MISTNPQAANRTTICLILLSGLVAYFNTFGNSFHYDDEHSILENPHIRSLGNVPSYLVDPGAFSGLTEARMYRPLLLVTYALNYAVGGYEPFGYHLVNLVLHLANALLVWRLALVLNDGRGGVLAALVFLLHPVMSEPVNYISSRSSLLATLFFLLAMLLLVRDNRTSTTGLIWSGVAYAAALGSKSIAISWLPIAAVYLWLWSRGKSWRMWALPVIVSISYAALTRSIVADAVLAPVRSHPVQWATQIKAAAFYLWTVIMPSRLSVEPQFHLSGFDPAVPLALLLLFSLAVLAWRSCRHNPLIALGVTWFFVALAPSSLVPLYVLVNEHRLYLPMVGVALLASALATRYRGRPAVAGLFLLILLTLTVQRNRVWIDEETLWADAVAKGPEMARPYANLGKSYLEQGRNEDAARVSYRAIEIDPTLEKAYYNLGTAHLNQGEPELAISHYQRALELRPDLFEARNNLGNALQELGRLQEAVEAYEAAIELLPRAQVYHNMGGALLRLGDVERAIGQFRRALELDGDMRESYVGMAKAQRRAEQHGHGLKTLQLALQRWPQDRILWRMTGDAHAARGEQEKAVRTFRRGGLSDAAIQLRLGEEALRRQMLKPARDHFQEALALAEGEKATPADLGVRVRALNGLGEIAYSGDDFAAALQLFRRAAQEDPKAGAAYANIGRTYLKHGGAVEAVAALERAVALVPENALFHALLAEGYNGGGNTERAIAAYQEAVRLAPDRADYHHNLGMFYHRNGFLREAERSYRAALERQPSLAGGHYNLGNLQLDTGRLEGARQSYETALQIQPDHDDALINLAAVLVKMDRTAEAVAAYRRFLGLHGPGHELTASVRSQIDRLGSDH